MSLSKYSKRRGQFEALEAKQLFAADLVGGAAADLADTAVVAENISEDDFVIIPLNVRTNLGGIKTNQESVVAAGTNQSGSAFDRLGGQEGEPLMNTNLGDHLVVDGEGLYQRNELELAPNLGGQEGEPLMNTSLADHLMVEGESLQSFDHTGIRLIDPADCPELVDHVFQDYARDDFYNTDVHYFAVR